MPAFGIIQRRLSRSTVLASQYEKSYYDYVTSLGGTVIDRNFVSFMYKYFIDYDILDGLEFYTSPKAGVLLSSNSVTNLLASSHNFDTSAWTKTDVTVTRNTIANPIDGAVTADLLTEGTAGTAITIQAYTTSSGATCTNSIYIKKNSALDWVAFAIAENGAINGVITYFNISSGIKGTTTLLGTGVSINSTIESLPNSWYRLTITGSNPTFTSYRISVRSASADASTTRVNNASYYVYAPQAQTGTIATDYIDSRNLAYFSEVFSDSEWGKTSGVSITPNVIASPNETLTADLLTGATGLTWASAGLLSEQVSSLSSSTTYTFSIYVKAGTSTTFSIGLRDQSTGNQTNASITPTSEWQRISVTRATGGGTTALGLLIGSTNGTVYIWGAQLELGSTASSYVVSVNNVGSKTTTQSFVQRLFDMSKPLKRNLLVVSQNLGSANWAKGDCSLVYNSEAVSDLSLYSWKGTVHATTALHYFRYAAANNLLETSLSYNFSICLKMVNVRYMSLAWNGTSARGSVFDLQDGQVTTNGSSSVGSIESLGNGWYRCSIVFTPITTSDAVEVYFCNSGGNVRPSYLGNGTDYNLIGPAQLSAGALLWDYTPTQRNILTKSEEIDSTLWTKSSCSVTGVDTIADPNRRFTAEAVTANAGASDGIILRDLTLIANIPYTYSVWIKGTSNGSVRLGISRSDWGDLTTVNCNYTTEWQRFSVTGTITTTSGRVSIGGNTTFTNSEVIHVWGTQLDYGTTPSDYLKSNITENMHPADAVQSSVTSQPYWFYDSTLGYRVPMYDGVNDFMSVGDLPIYNNQARGSLVAVANDLNRAGGDAIHRFIEITNNVGASRASIGVQQAGGLFRVDSLLANSINNTSLSFPSNYNFVAGLFNWKSGVIYGHINGTTGATTAHTTSENTVAVNADRFNLGVYASNANRLYGYITDTIATRSVLTTTQLAQLRSRLKQYNSQLP